MKHENFLELYNGTLKGVIKEEGYIELMNSLKGEWYTMKFTPEAIEIDSMLADELKKIMSDLYEKVKTKKIAAVSHPYTYVANPEFPKIIKIYDPLNCGSSCSITSPDPTWAFSIVKPTDEDLEVLRPTKKKGFFSKILGEKK